MYVMRTTNLTDVRLIEERDRLPAIKALADASDAGQAKLTEDQLGMLE